MYKYLLGVLISILFVSASVATEARLVECLLDDNEEYIDGRLKLYQYDGYTHSILLEFKTDYGDFLPILFSCESDDGKCVDYRQNVDYRYSVTLKTRITDEFEKKLASIDIVWGLLNGDKWTDSKESIDVLSCNTLNPQ